MVNQTASARKKGENPIARIVSRPASFLFCTAFDLILLGTKLPRVKSTLLYLKVIRSLNCALSSPADDSLKRYSVALTNAFALNSHLNDPMHYSSGKSGAKRGKWTQSKVYRQRREIVQYPSPSNCAKLRYVCLDSFWRIPCSRMRRFTFNGRT